MTIYISTGGCSNLTCADAANNLFNQGFRDIEISGGIYDPDLVQRLSNLSGMGANLTLHNYFPLIPDNFVLNLASKNPDICRLSYEHVERAIKISAELGAKFYAVHAGFLFDPCPAELGRDISRQSLSERDHASEKFIENIKRLNCLARNSGV